MATNRKCKHAEKRTVMLEIDKFGDVYARVYCGGTSRGDAFAKSVSGCGKVIGNSSTDTFLGNVDVYQSMGLRIGEKRFIITIRDR